MTENLLLERKGATRKAALAQRKSVRCARAEAEASRHLVAALSDQPHDRWISGYMAIRTEIDPIDAMHRLHDRGRQICLPVIQGRGTPLLFRPWTPGCAMIEGDFGALIPRGETYVSPDVCIIPLVAFDGAGNRMGYGGGFYDRTLEKLRRSQSVLALGFAFAGQEVPSLPTEATDQRLDGIVTEHGHRAFD